MCELIDSKTLSRHLGITIRTVQRLCASGRLPHRRVGKLLKFNLDEVLDFTDFKPVSRGSGIATVHAESEDRHWHPESTRSDQEPTQSVLSPLEKLELEFVDKIKGARTADEAMFFKYVFRKKEKELEEAAREKATEDIAHQAMLKDREANPSRYENIP